ncbi:MAG TPA: Mur ligase domain-containing protein, partial [Candidatus Limnocylindrales bacterium]
MTRDAAVVGAGLAPARAPRAIRAGERIHVVGAAGAGASAAALLAYHAGGSATGCDAGGPSPYSAALEVAGIPLAWAHDPGHVTASPRPERLAVTKALTAVAPDHPELVAARDAGIPLEPWQQVVADAATDRRLVGIAGTHGKSTSAGWLVHLLVAAGADPSAFVGALLPAELTGVPATARWGRGRAFVVEADEYAGNFDAYRPSVALVTSAEWDHPDVFADRAAVVDAFEAWLRRAAGGGAGESPAVLVVNVGDAGAAELASRLSDWPGRVVATTLLDTAPQRIGSFVRGIGEQYTTAAGRATSVIGRVTRADATGTTLEVHGLDALAGPTVVRLPTAG